MKILVFAHQLEVGGTQMNAIELAAALRDSHGHDVVFFATPGPMVRLVEEKKLRYVPAPEAAMHPSLARIRALRALVRRERPDVLHVWDWWQCIDAYYAVHLLMRIPMVLTDMMSEGVQRLLPKRLPTTFGVPELVEQAKAAGREHVELLPPPVDVHENRCGVVDPTVFRRRCPGSDAALTLVTVSRLARSLKLESLLRTVDAVRLLGPELNLRLIIVGDGVARAELQAAADSVNTALGRPAVHLAGEMLDPRPAYSAADVIVGMGGSALRGMAFGKPVIVVGEHGFSAPFTPETAGRFLHGGLFGRGTGDPGNARLAGHIRQFARCPEQLPALGQAARQFVVDHFSIETVAGRLEKVLSAASRRRPQVRVAASDGLRTAAVYLRERRFLPGSLRIRLRPRRR